MMQHLTIRREKRESLIDNLSLCAKNPHFAVPTQARETTVLHKCWRLSVGENHLLEMPQGNVAHPEEARAAGVALLYHRSPNLVIRFRPTISGSGTVQHIAVDEVGPKMLKRTSHRLCDLIRKAGRRIVRQPMILPWAIGEFRLQKKICAGYYSRTIRDCQTLAYSGFEIMLALISGVDAAKPHPDR